MTSKLYPFSFPESGRTVHIRKASMTTITLDLMRKIPRPMPPLQIVDVGGQKIAERNYAHPDYEKSMTAWEQDINLRAAEVLFRKAVVVDMNAEKDDDGGNKRQREVQEYRELMEGVLELDKQDWLVWLKHIAIDSDERDLPALMDAIKKISEPSEGDIKALQNGFRGDVQRKGHLEMSNS